MSLIWVLALALQPTTKARGCLIPITESVKAVTLVIDHVLEFNLVSVFLIVFFSVFYPIMLIDS